MESSSPYSYNEVVSFRHLGENDAMIIRAETQMAWQGVVHPFDKLEQVLMKPLAEENIQVTMSIASRSSSQSWNDDLSFPSGFLLEIVAPHVLASQKLQALLEDWIDHRVVTTPIQGAIWDVFACQGVYYKHHLSLPTVGAAWSADAWQQTMQALLPTANFMGISAMQWSKLFVDGHATHKQFWIQWTQRQATMGVQFQSLQPEESSSSFDLVQTLLSDTSPASCPLARRVLQQLPPLTTTEEPPKATLESVLRRPHANSPNHGRFETWFTSTKENCQVELRQKLPHYLEPQWQTLEITTEDNDSAYNATVEWDESDLSSVLTITSSQQSLMVSLDYEPAFLSLNDFPGDPNRGRELPPTMVTLVCSTRETTLYSNSLLILPPVPDMSMPFNVLSLTCSLYAYLIGTLLTLLVKRVSERIYYQLHPSKKPLPKWQQVKAKILSKFAKYNKTVADARSSSNAQGEEVATTSDKTGDKQETT